MEFTVSKKELARRKKAFAALLASSAIGIFLFSGLFDFPISPAGFLSIGAIFLLLCIITFQYLNSLSQIKILITDREIKRTKGAVTEKYSISEIKELKIKKRKNAAIREIYIFFHGHKQLYMNGFEEKFTLLKDALTGRINRKVPVKEIREPLNFDHPLFYPALGLLVSCFGIYFLKQVINTDYAKARVIMLFFSVYTLFLALYFIFKKPISVRSYKNQVAVDYIFGISMLFASIFMLIVAFI